MATVLIVYHTISGNTAAMAKSLAEGVRHAGHEPIIRAIPSVSYDTETTLDSVPEEGPPYVTLDDVAECDGLIVGSPTHFGGVAAPVAFFFQSIGPLWLSGALVDKPAGVFTSTGSMHGGQELVLQQLMVPLMHMGLCIVGIPYTNDELNTTTSGGTPYGASHLSRMNGKVKGLDNEESALCKALGKRVAEFAEKLKK